LGTEQNHSLATGEKLTGTGTRTGQEQKRTVTEQAARHRLNTLGKRDTGGDTAGNNQE